MGIESVDMNKALSSEIYAAQCIRSGKLTGSERAQLASKWGADKIKLWESVDSTQYRIDDDDWNNAKEAGKNKAKEETGYSGKKSHASIIDAGMAGLSATGAISFSTGSNGGFVGGMAHSIAGDKAAKGISSHAKVGEGGAQKNLGARATVIMAAATALKYWLQKPNKDQHEAAMQLYDAKEGSGGLLVDGQYSLQEAQEIILEATEQTTELTEEAQEVNDEANENIENDKTNFDLFRQRYEAIKAKAQSGEQLTPDEKQLMQKLAPLMVEAKTNIETTQEDASTELDDKYSEIEGFESQYDEGAETIAEVQGLTDYAEGFDSTAKAMTMVEGISQSVNAISATRAAAMLSVSGIWNIVFAAIGYAAAASSGMAASQQFQWMSQISQEVDYREATQELGLETEDVYNEELDNFAGNMEIIDDMELAIPEDLELPDQSVGAGLDGGDSVDPLAAAAAGVDNEDGDDSSGAVDAGSDDTGAGETAGGLENDEDYTNVMGKGSDYTDILLGKAKRGENDKLVTDANGKVILTSTYANAIESVTGDNTGIGYSKEFIPAILANVLGAPFTEEVINKVRNGGSVDSEFAAKLVKTKSGQVAGETTVDNSAAATQKAKAVIDFYWPIFEQAASGWVRG